MNLRTAILALAFSALATACGSTPSDREADLSQVRPSPELDALAARCKSEGGEFCRKRGEYLVYGQGTHVCSDGREKSAGNSLGEACAVMTAPVPFDSGEKQFWIHLGFQDRTRLPCKTFTREECASACKSPIRTSATCVKLP